MDLLTDKINTTQLLQSLESTSSKQALSDTTFEAVQIASLAQSHLIVMVGLNLCKLLDQSGMIVGEATKSGQTPGGLLGFAALHEVAWCFREDKHADDDDQGPSLKDGQWGVTM